MFFIHRDRRVGGLTPGPARPRVDVSSGKTLYPQPLFHSFDISNDKGLDMVERDKSDHSTSLNNNSRPVQRNDGQTCSSVLYSK